MGYRSKYAELIKVENEEPNNYCDFCGGIFVNAEFVATDRPPPSFEFVGLVDPCDQSPTESVKQVIELINKQIKKSELEKVRKDKFDRPVPHWLNLDCMKASQKADELEKKIISLVFSQ